jgi:uncharacterized flavoprotein (TIGR03862 family)
MAIEIDRRPSLVAVIGGGPAGLMAAEVISQHGFQVDVYEAMPSVGRKFLMAGKGGLNITHTDSFDQFIQRYGSQQNQIKPMIEDFDPAALRNWVHGLGIETFIGSSGRVFPSEMKAAPLLRRWLRRLRRSGVNFHVKHKWLGWQDNEPCKLFISTPDGCRQVRADAVVLALGGASWPKLGSTGEWTSAFMQKGISIAPFKPANCGFEVEWGDYFKYRFAGDPIKSIVVSFTNSQGLTLSRKGDITVTEHGLEGGAIYALSSALREKIEQSGEAIIYLDLKPDKSIDYLIDRISRAVSKDSLANVLRKRLGIDGIQAGLLRELLSKSDITDPNRLCSFIKELPIRLVAPRPIEEAISSAGGVTFDGLDSQLMLLNLPGVFCAGEMLDWEAPTGGYLLTACFASGRKAGYGVVEWLNSNGRLTD